MRLKDTAKVTEQGNSAGAAAAVTAASIAMGASNLLIHCLTELVNNNLSSIVEH